MQLVCFARLLLYLLKCCCGSWEQLDTAEKVINRRPITFQWEGSQTDGVPLPLCPEQFSMPPRETAEEQRDFVASEEIHLKKSYYQQLSAIWETEYLISFWEPKVKSGNSVQIRYRQEKLFSLVMVKRDLTGSLVSSRSCMSVVISGAEQLLFVYTMDCYDVLFRSCTN